MAVAEKPVIEAVPRNPSVGLAQRSLAGAILLLVGLWVILAGLPLLWTEVLGVNRIFNEFLSAALLLIVAVVAAVGLGYLGLKAEQANYQKGIREGAIVGAIFLFLILFLTLWIGRIMEGQDLGVIGTVVAAGIGLGLLFLLYKWFSLPGFAARLGRLSDAGWFEATVFKGTQGVKIRRITVIAILVLGFWGIITLVNQRALGSGWAVNVPYTGGTTMHPIKGEEGILSEIKVKEGDPVKADTVLAVLKPVKEDAKEKTKSILAGKAGTVQSVKTDQVGKTVAPSDILVELEVARDPFALPLMFQVHLVAPLLMGLALVWLAWRVVNIPTFADFLIATEAEMNKVSWTTRRRLVQDTIVVLTTMLFMTVFLFVVDILWIKILSHDWIYVLQVDTREQKQKMEQKAQW